MNLLDQLRNARDSKQVPFHEYLIRHKPNDYQLHAFFEGKNDEGFYGTIIRRHVDGIEFHSYQCGNKKKVYETFEKLEKYLSDKQLLLFFVDQDFDPYIGIEYPRHRNIYTTDNYSIENEIVGIDMIEKVWAEIFHQSSGSQEMVTINQQFTNSYNEFCDFSKEISSWIIYHRKNGDKANLSSIKMKDIFQIDDNLNIKVIKTLDETISYLDQKTKIDTNMADWQTERTKILELFKNHQPKKYIRGKFELDFFIIFLNRLHSVLCDIKPEKIHINLSTANAIDIFAPRLSYPASLQAFIRNHLEGRIEKSR
ncbi:DUF4435 domain-containing protein [Spirochaeta lutea]|uniref:DUF4435 domain-containing protein n=1 Tax=Spirochaeta lutea TaxID=1480694 RepID=A0A098R407_9SPIO|nr:DUF4435 domain-containing protein [Spirochaeta lutea]KGE73477.1 hypothetical protein DC28_03395 [Spirochaeta lutea]